MRPPSTSELLGAWERGLGQAPPQVALALLRVAVPRATPDDLARLSIGQRDACLLDLRESSFGPRVVGVAPCPACAEQLELDFDVGEIRVGPREEREAPSAPLAVSAFGYQVDLRLPDTNDLVSSVHHGEVGAIGQALLERCVVGARHEGTTVPAVALPPPVVEAVEARMGELDPQADIRLALACPECACRWEVTFDIVSFLWMELHAWACRTLSEVHLLASAYGWRERDILALSPARRRFYLQAVGQ
jgi:hypothetical protein